MFSSADTDVHFIEASCYRHGVWSNCVNSAQICSINISQSCCVIVFNSELAIDESSSHALDVSIEFNALFSDSEELQHHLVVSDPWSDLVPVQTEERVVLMNVNVVEGDGVWLDSSSAHAPDLVAAFVVVEVLVVSSVWHREREVGVCEWVSRHVLKVFVAEFFCILNPAVYLAFESPVENMVGSVI